jgi:fatty-acyl-CoA synthase
VAARSHPAVLDCNVVGVPDERLGERVVLVAALAPGAEVDDQTLIDHIRSTIAAYKAPRQVVWVESIYRSPSGKSDYRWAREAAGAASAS